MWTASRKLLNFLRAFARILAMASALCACTRAQPNVHDTPEVRAQPCANCHAQAYLTATNPQHVGVFPETCNGCHNTKSWVPASPSSAALDHHWFPLANKHASAACAACHTKGYNKGDTPTDCVGCHQKDYDGAKNPPHTGFPTACASCHTDAGWKPSTVSGSIASHPWFPLVNKHANVVCASCHTKGYNKGDTPTDCVGCHQKDYDMAMSPTHAGIFPTACASCHSDLGWMPATATAATGFNHTWFPLLDKHATVACASCHTKGYNKGDTPMACVGCHQKDYDMAMSPTHTGVFPTACASCHSAVGWKPAAPTAATGFNHTWFPLLDKHATVDCASCHTKGYNKGDTPVDCVGCHQANYDSAMTPPHAGLPTTCATCHNAVGWSPSLFVHPWTLDGTHITTPCVSCHTGTPPRWAGTPTACVGCHLPDYQRSTFPGHNMFAQTCADCHTTTVWTGASGGAHPEANFPIKTGSHANAGIICADCHIAALGSPAKGQNTDCIHCHLGAHQRPATDTTHMQLNVANYPGPNAASPNFCLSCHPTG